MFRTVEQDAGRPRHSAKCPDKVKIWIMLITPSKSNPPPPPPPPPRAMPPADWFPIEVSLCWDWWWCELRWGPVALTGGCRPIRTLQAVTTSTHWSLTQATSQWKPVQEAWQLAPRRLAAVHGPWNPRGPSERSPSLLPALARAARYRGLARGQ